MACDCSGAERGPVVGTGPPNIGPGGRPGGGPKALTIGRPPDPSELAMPGMEPGASTTPGCPGGGVNGPGACALFPCGPTGPVGIIVASEALALTRAASALRERALAFPGQPD